MSDPTPTQTEILDAECQAVLARLLRAGDTIATTLAAEPAPATTKAEPFERVARAIRRTVVLIRHIAANPTRPAPPDTANAVKIRVARRRIASDLTDEIFAAATEHNPANELRAELQERMDDPMLDAEIIHRPFTEVINDIRRDLGLDIPNPYRRYTPPKPITPTPIEARRVGCAPHPTTPTNPIEDEDEPDDPEIKPNSLLATLLRRKPGDG